MAEKQPPKNVKVLAILRLRYRGYYYDDETGMYYLQSRYYDPEIKRFICADRQINTLSIMGTNLYVYCDNNSICRIDPSGKSWVATFWNNLKDAISGLKNVLALAGGITQTDSFLPGPADVVGLGLALSVLVGAVGQATYNTISNLKEDENEKSAAIPRRLRKQAYFTENPFDFKPFGLKLVIRKELGAPRNGGVIKWELPNSIAIFEWNEDFKQEPHYHVMYESDKNQHTGPHYKAGEAVPEPWNTIYFEYLGG